MRLTRMLHSDSAPVFDCATARTAFSDRGMAMTATLVENVDLIAHIDVGLCFEWNLDRVFYCLCKPFVGKYAQ